MNFCGARYDHQLEIPSTKVSAQVLCGPCVEEDDEDAHEHNDDDQQRFDVFSEEDDDIRDDHRAPLDIIQETLDDDQKSSDSDDDDDDDGEQMDRTKLNNNNSNNNTKERLVSVVGVGVGVGYSSPGRTGAASTTSSGAGGMNATTPSRYGVFGGSSSVPTTPLSSTSSGRAQDNITSPPSPMYLNPMPVGDWNADPAMRGQQSMQSLNFPALEPPTANFNRLIKRLEGGFRVHFFHPGQSTKEAVLLYLDQDRNRLCLETSEDEKKDGGEPNFWHEVPMEKILRLEVGGKSRTNSRVHQQKAFAIVVDQDPRIVYYDFVASTPIEREMIVSTMMAVIDRLETKVVDEKKSFPSDDSDAAALEAEKKFSSIVKGMEDRSGHSVSSIVKGFEERSVRPTVQEKKDRISSLMAEKRFSSFVKRLEEKRQSNSPPSIDERKSFSSTMAVSADGTSYSAALKGGGEDRNQSSSLTNRVSFASRVKVFEESTGSSSSSLPDKKTFQVAKTTENGEKESVPVVEAIDEQSHTGLTEKKTIVLIQGIDDSSPSQLQASDDADEPGGKDQKDITHIEDGGEEKNGAEAENGSEDGTMDAPILCSPSLEHQLMLQPEFSPRRSTQLLNDGRVEGTEATLVIHLEDVMGSNDEDNKEAKVGMRPSRSTISREPLSAAAKNSIVSSRSVASSRGANPVESSSHRTQKKSSQDEKSTTSQPEKPMRSSSPRPTPETMHLKTNGSFGGQKPSTDIIVPVKAKAEDLMFEFASSSGHLTSVWCADSDICAFALKDITDTCTSVFETNTKQAEVGCSLPSDFSDQQALIEEYVANALGAPSAFYTYLTEGEQWEGGKTNNEETKPAANGRVRNRSGVLNAQALRLRRLRSEMTFAAALKRSKETMQYVQTTQSFDDSKVLGSNKGADAVKRFHSSDLLNSVVGTMMHGGNNQEEEDGDVVAYYDSDPEDARTNAMHKKGPRVAQVDLKSREKAEVEIIEKKPESAFDRVKSTKRVSKKLDEDTIVQIVQTMTNERMTLIWHPTQREKVTNRSPLCVKVWIESGVCLIDGTFVLPKLSWSRVLDKDAEATRGRRLAREDPNKVDLLDICRVHATKSVDRQRHPFADARKSFFVETQSEAILFEALTTEERDRIVYGLKLVIARLASLLMLRDVRAAEEFFGSVAPPVPGEAPEWIQGSPESSAPPDGMLPEMNK